MSPKCFLSAGIIVLYTIILLTNPGLNTPQCSKISWRDAAGPRKVANKYTKIGCLFCTSGVSDQMRQQNLRSLVCWPCSHFMFWHFFLTHSILYLEAAPHQASLTETPLMNKFGFCYVLLRFCQAGWTPKARSFLEGPVRTTRLSAMGRQTAPSESIGEPC